MTEREKMLSGELYNSSDEDLVRERNRVKKLLEKFNRTSSTKKDKREALVRKILGKAGKSPHIESNVWFDYGGNTEVGDNFFCNYDCVFLDCAKIVFGDNVFIAPQCGFYTAGHPLEAKIRNDNLEYAKPIVCGSNVWIGGGVKVLPGVTIGDGAVIAGGSVVTRDVPPDTLVAGVPAREIKKIDNKTA